jgi:hypothetical protein
VRIMSASRTVRKPGETRAEKVFVSLAECERGRSAEKDGPRTGSARRLSDCLPGIVLGSVCAAGFRSRRYSWLRSQIRSLLHDLSHPTSGLPRRRP